MPIVSDFEHVFLQLELEASAWNQNCQVADPFSPEHLSWLDSPVQPMIPTPGIPSHTSIVGALTFLDLPSFSAMPLLIYVRHIALILPLSFLALNFRNRLVNVRILLSSLCVYIIFTHVSKNTNACFFCIMEFESYGMIERYIE